MHLILILCSFLFSLFSSVCMTFVAMATPIGPWISPTLSLFSVVFVKIFKIKYQNFFVLPVLSGSIGGIVATAIGFSYPALYFIDKDFFNDFLSRPNYFILSLFFLILASSFLGWLLSIWFEDKMLMSDDLPFPVGKLNNKILSEDSSENHAINLVISFFSTIFYGIIHTLGSVVYFWWPKNLQIIRSINLFSLKIPSIFIDCSIFPMLFSIGFISGPSIVIPILFGTISKMLIIDNIHLLYFSNLSEVDFLLAFCAGMVLVGVFEGLIFLPKKIKKYINTLQSNNSFFDFNFYSFFTVDVFVIFIFLFFVLSLLSIPWYLQVYLIISTMGCAYNVALISGKIGVALLGRFATFVMIPSLFIFGATGYQSVIIATFVELVSGVVVDLLFGLKAAKLANIDKKLILRYQLLGILLAAIFVSISFWVIITHVQLGSVHLCAQRAQARALLIQVSGFDYYVVFIGLMFGSICKLINISPMFVLGGFLMSPSLIIGLSIGGLSSLKADDKEYYDPICSGIFAANSLWLILTALFFVN